MTPTNSPNPIRILVADDHPVVRQGLAALVSLQPDMTVVGEAANGREAVEMWEEHRPDVLLLDLRMPEMHGVAALAAIRAKNPQARVLVLTTFDTDEEIYRGLRAGAMGYLLKESETSELLGAIRAAHAGKKHIPSAIAAKLSERMNTPELTPRELDVLRLVAQGKSNKEIACGLYLSEGTVRAHLNSIFPKLGVSDRTQATTQAIRRGIVRVE